MICPECGTRLSEGKTRCHFCGHIQTKNKSETLVTKEQGNNFEDPEISDVINWEISSYDAARISMLSVILASFAFIISTSNALIEAIFPKISITTGNQTVTLPIQFKIFGFPVPLFIILFLLSVSILIVMVLVFIYFTIPPKNARVK